MGLNLVTPPTLEPLSLDEAKMHCHVDTDEQDGDIAAMIFGARDWVETQVGPLMTQTWDYTVDDEWPILPGGVWRYGIRLPLRPVQSITSVQYVDTDGVTQTLSASPALYTAHLTAPRPYLARAYGQSWPTVRRVPDAITVRFVAGYGDNPGDVPHALRTAIKLIVGHLYANREQVVVGLTASQIPFGVETLISPYYNPVVV